MSPQPIATTACSTGAAGAAGCSCPRSRSGSGTTSATTGPARTGRAIVRRAFDLGIIHHDLANNYGPPYGSAEENYGRIFGHDLRPYRDELVISTKAGYDMWPGPYGEGGGTRKYVLASLDQSLARMGLEYVDIFYSHRFDPETPLEETIGALDTAVKQGKALYAGISSYSPEKTREAAAIGREPRHADHDPPAVLLDAEPLDRAGAARTRSRAEGIGCIGFSPLAQGVLTDRYLDGIPEGSRAATEGTALSPDQLNEQTLAKVRGLNEIASRPRPDARRDGARVDAARPADDLDARRRVERRAARGERRRARQPRFHGGRARGDRPLRDRERHQPLGGVEHSVT